MKPRKCIKNNKECFIVEYTLAKKRIRKFFYSKKDANAFISSLKKSDENMRSQILSMSDDLIRDIFNAIQILPKGRTLTDAVQIAWQFKSYADINLLAKNFIDLKKAKGLSHSHIQHTESRIYEFINTFQSFEKLNPTSILNYIKSKGSQKTILHWRSSIADFMAFCFRKDAININPFDKLSFDDFVVQEQKKEIGFLSIQQATDFMNLLQSQYPQYCKFYALALFAGVRVEECERIKDDYIDYETKKITFPKEIVKGGKIAWVVDDFEDNLWIWLNKYKDFPFKRPSNTLRTKIGKILNLPSNFTRHSFATYHLSLYKDAERTRFITRHSNAQTLQNHYFGALVDKDTAKKYFEIVPT